MTRRILAVVLIAVLGLTATGCVFREVTDSKTRSETRDVADFEAVSFSGFGNLTLVQDDEYGLEIEGSSDDLERIEAEVRGDTLYIDWRSGWSVWIFPWSHHEVDIVVTAPEFTNLEVAGAGNVTIDELSGDEFAFELSGAGALYGRDIDLDELTVNLSGAGSADLTGVADTQEITISGAGSYDAGSLESKETRVEMSGAGGAVVWTKRVLDVEVSGAGSVEYYGDPKVSQQISGAGSITHRGSR